MLQHRAERAQRPEYRQDRAKYPSPPTLPRQRVLSLFMVFNPILLRLELLLPRERLGHYEASVGKEIGEKGNGYIED